MANLTDDPIWATGIYQLETTDPMLGGPPNPATGAGMDNIPHLQLAQRTRWLRDQLFALQAEVDAMEATVNGFSVGRPVIAPVLVATTANIALSGLQTIDGVSVTSGRRVLVKNQTTPAQNGVYITSAGVWARATDLDQNTDVVPGTMVAVTAGATQAETLWTVSSGQEGDAITIGSTALSFSNVTALMAPLASPVLTGSPQAPTPAQFNASQLLATTQFVQRALGNFSDAQTFSGSFTLTAADAGKCYVYGETVAATVTLPAISAAAIGTTFEFINTGTADLTVQRAGSDQIDNGPTSVTSIVVPPGQSLKIVRSGGSSLWHPVGITAQALGSTMQASLLDNGWQRLPSGLILQWGRLTVNTTPTAVTFPIAFPNAARMYGIFNNSSASYIVWATNPTASGMTVQANQAGQIAIWFALGN